MDTSHRVQPGLWWLKIDRIATLPTYALTHHLDLFPKYFPSFHHSAQLRINITSPKGPYRLVTVNTPPERANRLIRRMVEALKEEYSIDYVANCESK
jgi:hypothetical protein